MPFVLERDGHSDEFKRAPLAEALSQAMLEHDRDRLPLNVGIFGAWGTGKTQFMKMVESVVDSDKRTKTVWFEPWKYESRQDVGLGLMLAIVRAVEQDKNAGKTAKIRIGKTGAFLLKAFRKTTVSVIDIISAINLGTIVAESLAEVKAESLNIQSEIDEALGELRGLIKAWVGKDGRCFVFVDDLDRCLPEQMISLIEALHLYMADTPCYFTVGIDREAISTALNNRYPGLNSDLGRVYLDKIFPVSMNLSPPTNRNYSLNIDDCWKVRTLERTP